jgi:hypothetical protein
LLEDRGRCSGSLALLYSLAVLVSDELGRGVNLIEVLQLDDNPVSVGCLAHVNVVALR